MVHSRVAVKQALVMDPEIAPYVCGYVVGSAPQCPGITERYTLEVDEDICGESSVISMASMTGKLTYSLWEGKHVNFAILISKDLSISMCDLDLQKSFDLYVRSRSRGI